MVRTRGKMSGRPSLGEKTRNAGLFPIFLLLLFFTTKLYCQVGKLQMSGYRDYR